MRGFNGVLIFYGKYDIEGITFEGFNFLCKFSDLTFIKI